MRHRFRRPQQAPEEVRELARRVVRPVSRGLVMYATVAAQNIRTVWTTMVVTKAGAVALLNTYERHVRQFCAPPGSWRDSRRRRTPQPLP
jgi:hypothetical protein